MEIVSFMEVDDDGSCAPNVDLQVALGLKERLHKLSAGLVSGDEVAKLWSILEIAAQELGIYAKTHPKTYKRRKKRMDSEGDGTESAVCRHSCSLHMEVLDPVLWGSLPLEMVQLIFSRLSVCDIRRLRCLSKDWRTWVTSDPDFHRMRDAVDGSLFAFITTDSYALGSFWIRALDVKSNKWENFKIVVKSPAFKAFSIRSSTGYPPQMMTSLMCGDAGLLCFVSCAFHKSKVKRARPSLFFTIVNPLTGVSHGLPPLHELRDVRMVQIIGGSETKSFKVFVVVDYEKFCGDDDVETGGTTLVYDSTKGCWGRDDESLNFIVGRSFHWEGDYLCSHVDSVGLCAFDFAGRRMLRLDECGGPFDELYGSMKGYTHIKDRIFLLRFDSNGPASESLGTESSTYYIEEFYVQMPARAWVKVCTHRCAPFERPPKNKGLLEMNLYACRGFLMVVVHSIGGRYKQSMRYDITLGWLYDLSSCKWRDLELPQLPFGRRTYDERHSEFTVTSGSQTNYYYRDFTCEVREMCELRWSA